MDPASILALTNTCVNLAYRLGVLTNNLYTIGKRYNSAEQSARLIVSQLNALSAAVRALNIWLQSDIKPNQLQLVDEIKQSLDSCDTLIQFVLDQLSEWQVKTDKLSFWHRAKYLWDEATVMRFEGMLRGQVQALSLLLQVKDFTSFSEQVAFLNNKRASTILRYARDDTSSLLWLRDADSTRSTRSMMTDNLEAIDVEFDFDDLIVSSKVYRSTLASFLKRKIRRDNEAKAQFAALDHANREVPNPNVNRPSSSAMQPESDTSKAFPTRRTPVATNSHRQSSYQNSSQSSHEVMSTDMTTKASVESNVNATARTSTSHIAPTRDVSLRNMNITTVVSSIPLSDQANSDATVTVTLASSLLPKHKAGLNTPSSNAASESSDAWLTAKKREESVEGLYNRTSRISSSTDIEDGDMDSDELYDDMSRISSSPSLDEDIDFEHVYALHTFVAVVEGQANVTKGDRLELLDDSNSYWWLVRTMERSIGYIPAEHVETPTERLARLNKHRNIDLAATMLGDRPQRKRFWSRGHSVSFNITPVYISTTYSSSESDIDTSTEWV